MELFTDKLTEQYLRIFNVKVKKIFNLVEESGFHTLIYILELP